MTTVPVSLHRELSKEQQTPKEMSTFRLVVLLSAWGLAIYLVMFGFYFSLPQL